MSRHAKNSSSSGRTFTRRRLIKSAGAAAAAASVGAVALSRAQAAQEAVPADAIIIGAGYAGATVARELAERGLKPVVLEARDRVGGRVWTNTWAGEEIEIGGSWLGPQQELAHAELSRYNIGTFQDVAAERVVMPGNNGLVTVSPADAAATVDPLWESFYEGSAQYFERPHEPLYRSDLLADVDPLSLQDRLDQLSLSPTELEILNGETSIYSGGPSTIGSLTGMAQWIQLAGGTYQDYLTTMSLRPEGGMIAILNAMLDEAQANVRLNTAVTGITEQNGKVTVTCSGGGQFTAPVVVVAVPVNTWKSITFNPGLPTAHARASSEGIGVPHATKVWLQIKGNVPATQGMAREGTPLPMLIPQQQTAEGRLMIGFAGPSLNVNDASAVQDAVRTYLPNATLVRYRAMEWAKQQYTKGGWGLRRPNQLLSLFPAIEEPHGRIVFAGADIARGWHGAFIEGAIESGLRAAGQAAELA
ncbi:flavin monoamine oxidase family protein [Streptomyces sp. 8N616]|uniref:flavin monoamine oxidase family protein n=1 Tax=Streptomyces sp. 8N616 TaxID=3457414 RepID=UPI003FD2292C